MDTILSKLSTDILLLILDKLNGKDQIFCQLINDICSIDETWDILIGKNYEFILKQLRKIKFELNYSQLYHLIKSLDELDSEFLQFIFSDTESKYTDIIIKLPAKKWINFLYEIKFKLVYPLMNIIHSNDWQVLYDKTYDIMIRKFNIYDNTNQNILSLINQFKLLQHYIRTGEISTQFNINRLMSYSLDTPVEIIYNIIVNPDFKYKNSDQFLSILYYLYTNKDKYYFNQYLIYLSTKNNITTEFNLLKYNYAHDRRYKDLLENLQI